MLNKSTFLAKTHLPVMEQFYTLQGEGYHQGKAAYFIRLSGCDIGCTWCDVKESWQASNNQLTSIKSIVENCKKAASKIVVVTGGEPCIYSLQALTKDLKKIDKQCHLETSGAYSITGEWDWICISPKRFKLPLKENMALASEFKTVISHKNDLRFAQEFEKQLKPSCKLYLQPEWSVQKKVNPYITEFIKKHPQYTASLQIHNYMKIK